MAATPKLTTDDFITHPEVVSIVNGLKEKYRTKPLLVSDVLDDKGHQYVHLVQKGGGVLGIALVGYTFILEQMGIRFLKQAGTSAGAINTALMTVIGTKPEAKSMKILQAICDLDFFSLVDGHPVARWLIRNFIRQENFGSKAKRWVIYIFALLALLIVGDVALLIAQRDHPTLWDVTKVLLSVTALWIVLILAATLYVRSLINRLKNAGYGMNPGKVFYNWINGQMLANGVATVTDLKNKAGDPVPGLHLRVEHPMNLKGLEGEVTFIASELVTGNKIQFPAMCNLFRKSADIDSLAPAGFVRASMSIPVFFESYIITGIPCRDEEVRAAWRDLNVDDPPSYARFVDGGILSNFPISIFYNPQVAVPRLPVFGIDLDDTKPENKSMNAEKWSLGGYMQRMFNTIRNYYDKDFLLKNKIYQNGIGKIPVYGFNWLNFFMNDKDKVKLFVLGAKAAASFLENFQWYDYKGTRAMMEEEMQGR